MPCVVDALCDLEALGVADERCVDVARIFLFFDGEVMRTQKGVLVGGEETALAARRRVKLAASGKCGGASGLQFHFGSPWRGGGYPHPGCFGGKSAEVTVNKETEFWRVPKSAQATGSKGDR